MRWYSPATATVPPRLLLLLLLLQPPAATRVLGVSSPQRSGAFHCCVGQHLRIGVYDVDNAVADFIPAPGQDLTDGIDDGVWTGFLPNLYHRLALEMGFTYMFVPISRFSEASTKYVETKGLNITSDSEWSQVVPRTMLASGDLDAIMDDPRIAYTESAGSGVALTIPLVSLSSAVMVFKERVVQDMWAMFKPFESSLWLAISITTCAIGFVMICLRALEQDEGQLLKPFVSPGLWAKSIYYAWVALLGGEEHESLSVASKLLRVGMLFMILIIGATYTANLAAFFTAPNVVVHGPTDLDTLSRSKVCYLYEEWLSFTTIPAFVQSIVFPPSPPSNIKSLSPADIRYRIDGCMELMRSGEVDAMVEQDIFLAVIVNDMYSCKEWAIVPDLNFAPQFQSLAFRDDASGNAFARNVSIAFAHFVTQKEYGEMVSNQLKLGQTCDADDEAEDTTPIEVGDMKGLFYVVGIFMALSILTGMADWRKRSCGQKTATKQSEMDANDSDSDLDDLTQGEMLRMLLERVAKLDTGEHVAKLATGDCAAKVPARMEKLDSTGPATSPPWQNVVPESTSTADGGGNTSVL